MWSTVSPGNLHDSRTFKGLYDKIKDIGIETLIADSGYKTPAIAKLLIDDGIKPLFPYKRPMTKEGFFKKHEYVYDEYYANNPYLMVQTENAMLKYEVVSAFYADSQEIFDDKGRSEITRINSADNESECEEFVKMITKRRLYNTDLTDSVPDIKDRYLMLVTCEYSGDDNRMVVIGRLSDACTVFEE